MNNIAWLHTMTKSGRVTRYHNTPMITDQSVADHTWGVAMCLLWLTDGQPSMELLKAALYHDTPELITGDIPAPAKVDNQGLVDALNNIEDSFMSTMEIDVPITDEEKRLLSIADTMELLLHCKKEMRMGNTFAGEVFDKGATYLVRKYHSFCNGDTSRNPTLVKLNSFMANMNISTYIEETN